MNWEANIQVEEVHKDHMWTVRMIHRPTGLSANVTATTRDTAHAEAEKDLRAQLRPLTVDSAANAIREFVHYVEERGDNVYWIEGYARDFLEIRQQRVRDAKGTDQ